MKAGFLILTCFSQKVAWYIYITFRCKGFNIFIQHLEALNPLQGVEKRMEEVTVKILLAFDNDLLAMIIVLCTY